MMAKTTIPIAMLLALVLGAMPAAAGDRSRDKREPKIEKIAHKLAKATDELYVEAYESRRFHRSWAHRSALRGLRELDRSAQAFHARVHREGIYDYDTQRAFQRLERAHAKAVYRLDQLRTAKRLRGEVRRVEHLMRALDTKLARVETHRRGRDRYAHRGHDRYAHRGHDRYAHRGHDRGTWRASFAWNF